MVNIKTGERRLERALRWEDVFDQVVRDSAHGDLDSAIVVGICADGPPEMFLTGTSAPADVIAALNKLEGYILGRCIVAPDGSLHWKGMRDDANLPNADVVRH